METLDDFYLASRELPDGRMAWVYPQITGTARLVVGDKGVNYYQDGW